MPTVRDQINLEKDFTERSASKYYNSQDKLRTQKQHDQTDAARYIMQQGIMDAADILQNIIETQVRGLGAKYNQLVKLVASRVDEKTGEIYYDYRSVVYMGLVVLFRAIGDNSGTKFTYLKTSLAHVLESDAKARLFEAAYPGYYFTVMKSMQEQGVTQYTHIHKVIMTKFRHFEMQWKEWSIHEVNAVAQKIYNAILVAMPEIFFKHTYREGKKTVTIIDTTVAADDWFANYEKEKGLLNPNLPPMIVPPVPWYVDDGEIQGGYTTPRMCSALPFIKSRSAAHQEHIRKHTPEQHISAVNRLQATAWSINPDVLEVQRTIFKSGNGGVGIPTFLPLPLIPFPEHLKDIPVEHLTKQQQEEVLHWKVATKKIHTKNRLNKSKVIAYKMIFDAAVEYNKYDEFYFVYNNDFRGRVYCATAGLSPQGSDLAKGLLRFAEPCRLGEDGLKWLAIHGANVYGYDKVSNDDRIAWIRELEPRLRDVVERPLDTREFWGSADKPWQFLAFAFEWARSDYGRNKDTLGFLPVGLDGSCNGIQHYSAILRDRTGGSGVNLTDGTIPSDIYAQVAERLVRILKDTTPTTARQIWLNAGINRKLTKRPVMTLPYGSTQQSAKQYIYEWILDNKHKFKVDEKEYFALATYLTPIMWEAIGLEVIASRQAMDWLKKVARAAVKEHKQPLAWTSPAGFPVFQSYYITNTIAVDSMLLGTISVKTPATEVEEKETVRIKTTYRQDTDRPNLTRQLSGIAPNFVHSVDASHMIKTINACPDDMHSFAMIHDDFGTHAGRTQELWTVIREQFHTMYTESDPLQEWYEQMNISKDIPIPEKGDLDIDEVLSSTYFFG